jgi:hypothetical protein
MSRSISTAIASDAGHWYTPDGAPCYTLVGANGRERNTTLKDARVMGLYPSVTTITKCAAAPGLVNWMVDQAILSALTLPRREGESEADWLVRVKQDSKETARKAADRGTQIHTAIERHFLGKMPDGEMWPYVKGAVETLDAHFPGVTWDVEKSFAHPLGYGGKCDLHSKADKIVVDWKGKDFTVASECKQYDEHIMQGAAYLMGFGIGLEGRFANAFVSRTVPGLTVIIETNPEDIKRGWRMFQKLLEFWQEQNRYRPMVKEAA